MHLRIRLDYDASSKIKKLSPDGYHELRLAWPALDLPEIQPKEDEKFTITEYYHDKVVDQATAELLTRLEIEFVVRGFKGTYKVANENHSHLHIALPGIGLIMVDEVINEDDCCTDRLQSRLDEGYRILAVCPPKDQRRPDYILGRTKKDDR